GSPASLDLVEDLHAFENYLSYDLQALGGELIHRVLRSVVEDVAVAVIEIDQIQARHAALNERQMIVFNGDRTREEMRLISQAGCGLINHAREPGRGVGVTVNVQVGVANHVGYMKGLDVCEGAVFLLFV